MKRFPCAVLVVLLFCAPSIALAAIELPAVVGDHMVIQRDRPAPIWGAASPGARITVEIAGQTHAATAGDNGRWRVTLDPLPAGGPHDLSIRGDGDAITIADVLVGEVWVCSGQSNMAWPVSLSDDAKREIAAADHPRIRVLRVASTVAAEPRWDSPGKWTVCSPETVGNYSAVAYYFGRSLQAQLDVPVGLIQSAWGGTPIEAWMSRDALTSLEEAGPILERYAAAMEAYPEALAKHQQQLEARKQLPKLHPEPANTGEAKGYASPEFDDSAWKQVSLPTTLEAQGLKIDGVVWFRRQVDLPADWAGRPLTLELGAIDDGDVTYFNGERVGAIAADAPRAWTQPRRYTVRGEQVKAGTNTIAVRVFDHYGSGGFTGPAEAMTLTSAADKSLALAGPWRMHVEHALDPDAIAGPSAPSRPFGPDHPHSPAGLYNGMIHPLIPFAIRGAIWYQGETNASRAQQYRSLFPAMIGDWRDAWGQGDFPFLFVQLANFMAAADKPTDTGWAHLRDAQLHTLRTVPHTGMAVTIDIGNANDIHPRNKQDVGARLARWALAQTYGRDLSLAYSGPIFRDMSIKDGKAILSFDHVGGGLTTRDGGPVQGFAVAGADRKFVWADAVIEEGQVIVSSQQVAEPIAVRYAWANNPVQANLVNEDGLPASPFRTDDWPGPTDGRR